MKYNMVLLMAGWLTGGSLAFAQGNYGFTANATVPDADANGVALVGKVSGLEGTITSLSVSLNITNGYNGDLYAWLAGPNGGFAVLMNRLGVGNVSSAGYANARLDVWFVSGANNIHFYQDFGPAYNVAGQLTGNWSPDGRNLDPASAPALIGGASPSATLAAFNGTDPNGTWVLFVADFSNGSVSTVNQWGLNISTTGVPEPSAFSLIAGGAALMTLLARRRLKHSSRW